MEKEKKNENSIKMKEKFSLNMRKKWLVDGTKTFLIVAILVAAYIALNLWIDTLDLPEIDVTANKIYTLSDESKKAVESVTQEVKIYAYGFEEDGQLIKFLKQYNQANDKISYEILTEESNYQMVQENDLQEGYYVLIFESGDSRKLVDASTEFVTYDYTSSQQIDTTEQTITNAILALQVTNKPKVYFLEGHQEYDLESELTVLTSYLNNEAFEIATLNLATAAAVPEDCDVLAIMSPAYDFYDNERDMIIDYINKGGNIYFSMDTLSGTVPMPNITTVLAQYGVSFENGYIVELDEQNSMSTSPNIFMPQVSSSNSITSDIYTDSYMWLAYSARLKFESDETLTSLNVEKEDLLTSTENSIFVTDLASEFENAITTAITGKSVISSIMTKTLSQPNELEEGAENPDVQSEDTKTSTLVIIASGNFISNYKIEELSQTYPISYIGSNKDFVINSIAKLADKESGLTIRKDMASSTYTPTEEQNRNVLLIIFTVPLLIIVVGIVIWAYRKKRK